MVTTKRSARVTDTARRNYQLIDNIHKFDKYRRLTVNRDSQDFLKKGETELKQTNLLYLEDEENEGAKNRKNRTGKVQERKT